MNRDRNIASLKEYPEGFDVVIVGGGATGLGSALEAVTRGLSVLVLEQHDFAKGTSSRSTKLVHGGVRYLAQGNVSLVLEALRERGRLKRNAPHLVRDQAFIIPCYKWWCVPFYTIGLTLYDLMAGRLGIGRSLPMSPKAVKLSLPSIKSKGLKGGVRYYDGQFDDSRLAINLAQSVEDHGGRVINHMPVKDLIKENGHISGVEATDIESGKKFRIKAGCVVNATGVFVDEILKMEDPAAREIVKPSQGIHLVMEADFLGGGADALMIPKTSDGRVLFAVPWHNRIVMGTTDVEKNRADLEPEAEQAEIAYILETAGRFMERAPVREDVYSLFTGLRPLAAPAAEGKKTKEISRGHRILISRGGMLSITGGKWTTYRSMGEDLVNQVFKLLGKNPVSSRTDILDIHGYRENPDLDDPLYWYGSDREKMDELLEENPSWSAFISEELHIQMHQVIWAVREEMARSVEDFLARRTRALQLDAKESMRIAPAVAVLMAEALGRDEAWIKEETDHFIQLAEKRVLPAYG